LLPRRPDSKPACGLHTHSLPDRNAYTDANTECNSNGYSDRDADSNTDSYTNADAYA
jgi:hypothetical protein